MTQRLRAFTLLEVLVSLALLALLGLVFVRIFGSTFDATSNINARNDLLHEAQIAEQIIASKVKLAWYIYPPGTIMSLNSGNTVKNVLAGSSTWIVDGGHAHPILAMVLPPKDASKDCNTNTDGCFRFYAYYAFPRSHYVSSITSSQKLDPDAQNDSATWVLMEYRQTLTGYTPNYTASPPCTNVPVPSNDFPGSGRLLVEYVQPTDANPNYKIFTFNADGSVEIRLRMLKKTNQRTVRVPPPTDPPLTLKATPRNLLVGCTGP